MHRKVDPEFGVSKGCLLPKHKVLGYSDVSKETRKLLQNSLIMVHGGMAQDVGTHTGNGY